jgi:hypothetical protein
MASLFYTPRAPLDGGVPFFGIPACELHNETVSLDTLWRTFVATISAQLWEARTAEARFLTLEHCAARESSRPF